jgi:hypothetical protein
MAQRDDYTATASQTLFTYTFQIYQTSEIQVYVNDVLRTETTHYSVTIETLPTIGGTVTLVLPSTAGDVVSVVQNIPITRLTTYATDGDWKAAVVNADFDRIYALLTQDGSYSDINDRLVKFSNSEDREGKTNLIPTPVANQYLGWSSGGEIVNQAAPTVSVSGSLIVTNVAAVKAIDVSVTTDCYMQGLSTAGDGGQNNFTYNASSSVTPDNELTIKPDSVTLPANGRWEATPAAKLGIVASTYETLLEGRKNLFINGDFLINQKGVAFTPSASAYTSDQWEYEVTLDGGSLGSNTADVTAFTIGQTDVPDNPANYLNFDGAITSGSNSELLQMISRIEDVRQYSGQQVTLSFWAKGSVGGDIAMQFGQNFGTGGSPSTVVLAQVGDITLTTAWVQQSDTFTMPSISGKTIGSNADNFLFCGIIKQVGSTEAALIGVSATNYAGTVDIADFQLELGSSATKFDRLQEAAQYLKCQRYYQKFTINGNSSIGIGRGTGTIVVGEHSPLATEMRAVPTITVSTNRTPTWTVITGGGGSVGGAVNIAYAGNTMTWRGQTTVTCVSGGGYWCDFGGSGHDLYISAEL